MSSSPPLDAEDAQSSQKPSPEQPQSQANPLQATEQQLKARAEGVSIEDYLLPRSITLRLAKSVLPPQTSVQKDAVLAIQKAATVFVSYLSSQANESTLKRTVAPSDVLNALSELEFEGFRPRLEQELDKFTEAKAAKRRPRKSEDAATTESATAKGAAGAVAEAEGEAQGEKKEVAVRGAKRVKRDGESGDHDQDEEDDEADDGEGDEGAEEEHDEDATEEEEEEEDDEEDAHNGREDEDIDRVEDLDRSASRRMVDPDAADSDSDDDAAGNQLRGDIGLG
ncbi:histone-fold-containing protein [Aspergillus unguis]